MFSLVGNGAKYTCNSPEPVGLPGMIFVHLAQPVGGLQLLVVREKNALLPEEK